MIKTLQTTLFLLATWSSSGYSMDHTWNICRYATHMHLNYVEAVDLNHLQIDSIYRDGSLYREYEYEGRFLKKYYTGTGNTEYFNYQDSLITGDYFYSRSKGKVRSAISEDIGLNFKYDVNQLTLTGSFPQGNTIDTLIYTFTQDSMYVTDIQAERFPSTYNKIEYSCAVEGNSCLCEKGPRYRYDIEVGPNTILQTFYEDGKILGTHKYYTSPGDPNLAYQIGDYFDYRWTKEKEGKYDFVDSITADHIKYNSTVSYEFQRTFFDKERNPIDTCTYHLQSEGDTLHYHGENDVVPAATFIKDYHSSDFMGIDEYCLPGDAPHKPMGSKTNFYEKIRDSARVDATSPSNVNIYTKDGYTVYNEDFFIDSIGFVIHQPSCPTIPQDNCPALVLNNGQMGGQAVPAPENWTEYITQALPLKNNFIGFPFYETLYLYDFQGKLIQTLNLSHSEELQSQINVPSGIYTLRSKTTKFSRVFIQP